MFFRTGMSLEVNMLSHVSFENKVDGQKLTWSLILVQSLIFIFRTQQSLFSIFFFPLYQS